MNKQITLHDWAARQFDPVPHRNTLTAWARDLKIYPYPRKVGRGYRVVEDAIYIGDDHNRIAEYVSPSA